MTTTQTKHEHNVTERKKQSCNENSHIKPTYFALWNKINGICKGKGINSFMLWPTRMAMFICSSPSAVKRSAKQLVQDGWLEELEAPTSGKKGGGVYRPVHHREWVRKHGLQDCTFRDYSLLEGAD
jgi:hypothetical protein